MFITKIVQPRPAESNSQRVSYEPINNPCFEGQTILSIDSTKGTSCEWLKNEVPIKGANGWRYSPKQTGTYQAIVTFQDGQALSEAEEVVVNPFMNVTLIDASDRTICSDDTIQISSVFYPGAKYEWKRNGRPVKGGTKPSLTVSKPGSYQLIVTSSDSCKVWSEQINIEIEQCEFQQPLKTTHDITEEANNPVINENIKGSLGIYPNPNNGSFKVNANNLQYQNQEMILEISNQLGQVIYKEKFFIEDQFFSEDITLDRNLPSGLYLLKSTINDETSSIRFLINR
jgi:hypothetical protein